MTRFGECHFDFYNHQALPENNANRPNERFKRVLNEIAEVKGALNLNFKRSKLVFLFFKLPLANDDLQS